MTANMGLTLPIPGQELGPQYALDLNGSLTTIDGHDHSGGNGVPITPAGINIDSDLPLNNHNLTIVNAIEYTSLSSPLAGSAPYLNSTYFSGGNFYVNDGSGNQVKITSGGTVNATSSGISSGTATASFVGGVLVVNSAALTPGNIQAGSILIGNNTASSNFTTISAATALAASYTLTLMSGLPAGQRIMTVDNTGNIASNWNVDNVTLQVTSNLLNLKAIPANYVDTAQIVNGAVTNPKLAALGQQEGAAQGNNSNNTTSYVDMVPSVTITTTGRPVYISLAYDNTITTTSYIDCINGGGVFKVARDGTTILQQNFGAAKGTPTGLDDYQSIGSFNVIDVGASAASHVYTFQVKAIQSGVTIQWQGLHSLAFEL